MATRAKAVGAISGDEAAARLSEMEAEAEARLARALEAEALLSSKDAELEMLR